MFRSWKQPSVTATEGTTEEERGGRQEVVQQRSSRISERMEDRMSQKRRKLMKHRERQKINSLRPKYEKQSPNWAETRKQIQTYCSLKMTSKFSLINLNKDIKWNVYNVNDVNSYQSETCELNFLTKSNRVNLFKKCFFLIKIWFSDAKWKTEIQPVRWIFMTSQTCNQTLRSQKKLHQNFKLRFEMMMISAQWI